MTNIKPEIQEAQKPKQDKYQTHTPLVIHIFSPLNTKTKRKILKTAKGKTHIQMKKIRIITDNFVRTMTSNSSKDLTRQTKTGKIHCQQTDSSKNAKEVVLQAEEI